MDEYWQIILTAFGGAFVGGIFSIVATIITFKSERKKQKEIDERHFEQELIWKAIERKEKAYIALVEITSKLFNIELEVEPEIHENGDIDVGNMRIVEVSEVMHDLSDYFNNNKAIIELYFPPLIKREIFELRILTHKISDQNINITNFYDVIESLAKQSSVINILICQDLKIPNSNLKKPEYKSYSKK